MSHRLFVILLEEIQSAIGRSLQRLQSEESLKAVSEQFDPETWQGELLQILEARAYNLSRPSPDSLKICFQDADGRGPSIGSPAATKDE